MASTRCTTSKVTKRRKTVAQRRRYQSSSLSSVPCSQSRQVVMKAKSKSAKAKGLSVSATQAALRQLPALLKKQTSLVSPAASRTSNHGYLLRSRSLQDQNARLTVDIVSDEADRLKLLSTSHDSGIESANNTSDSEDSLASERSDVSRVSFPPPEPRPLSLASSISPIHQVTIDLSIATSRLIRTQVTRGEDTAASESSFAVLADNLLHYGGDCIPDFLQDIDEVIQADAPSDGGSMASSVVSSCTTESVTEISLCHERLEDSISVDHVTMTEQMTTVTRYMYTASAGELEFVMEIFRGAHHAPSPLIRTPAVLPPKTRSCPMYTLILDLDETLVHCFTNDPPAKFDHSFSVEVPDGNGGESTELAVYARLRPFVKEFLERVARKFEVVVFTASMKNYSSKMLDLLDPDGVFFKHRFYRDHCVPVGCSFVKDLSIFTRDLSKLMIVDNQIASFAFQIDNGIPIKSWIGDDEDEELLLLAPFLEAIAEQEDLDVRHYLRESLKVPVQLHTHVQTYYPQHTLDNATHRS